MLNRSRNFKKELRLWNYSQIILIVILLSLTIYSSLSMYAAGGVRGALSIALLATLTSSGVVSQSEMEVVAAMVLGVVFISIMVQVPMLSSYAKKRFAKTIHIAK